MLDHDTDAVLRWIQDDDQQHWTPPPGAVEACLQRGLTLIGRDGRLELTEDGEFEAQACS